MPGRAGTPGAAAGGGVASGVPGAGPSPGPLRVELGTLGTVSETSLTVVFVVFSDALRRPSTSRRRAHINLIRQDRTPRRKAKQAPSAFQAPW